MLNTLREWILDLLAPGWDSPKPELKHYYDFKTGTTKLDMESFRNSKVVQAQMEACMAQSNTQSHIASTSGSKSNTSDRSRRRRRAKSSRRECPTTMHSL